MQALLDKHVVSVYVMSSMAKLANFKWTIIGATFYNFFLDKLCEID